MVDFDEIPADGMGIVIGATKALTADKIPTEDSPFRTGTVVQILSKSNTKFSKNGSKDLCNNFPYVKVKADSTIHWILGSEIFVFFEPDQGPVFSVGDDHYRVIKSRNFGPAALDEEGLLINCDEFYPLLLKNRATHDYKLISLSKSAKPKYNKFEFANLNVDAHKLAGVETDSNSVILKFEAEYMEDGETYEIRIDDLTPAIVTGVLQNRQDRAINN